MPNRTAKTPATVWSDYFELMTAEEMEILQARSDARPEVTMGVLLKESEKANMRLREAGNREIGR